MKDRKRLAYRLILALLMLWGFGKAFELYQIYFPNRNHPMIPLLQNMQTFCVGNYLIDLPRGSMPIRLETDLQGQRYANFLAYPGRSRFDFQRRVDKRWEAIKDWKQDGTIIFEQPSQRFDIMPEGVVMTYKHHTTNLKGWPDGTSGPKSFYETEGYLWRDDTLYEFTTGSRKDSLIKAMQILQVRKDDEIPTAQGFCGGRSFFPGQPHPDDYVWFAFRLPIDTNTEFRIEIPTIQSPRPNLALFQSDDIKIKTLRESSRTLAGFAGKEWMEYYWEKESDTGYDTSMSAAWFGPGKEQFGYPGIQLRLDAGIKADGIPPPKIGEMITPKDKEPITAEEFTALWDGIVASLRLRP